MKKTLTGLLLALLACVLTAAAEQPAFSVQDNPWDDGTSVLVKWDLATGADSLSLQKADSLGVFQEIFKEFAQIGQYTDSSLEIGKDFRYRLVAYNQARGDSLVY
ncbi:MAG: hypothetical protein PHG32_09280, partial [Candidatus Cloacimonetes bacterium]|nr:hypothetical protein [Candidatus Cloacimonadota bacterium]